VMAGRGPFNVAGADMNSPMTVINPSAQRPQIDHQIHMSYSDDAPAAVYGHVNSSPMPYPAGNAVINHLGNSNSSEQRRKRGRPRKYAPDGGSSFPSLSPPPVVNSAALQMQNQIFSPPDGGGSSAVPTKRPRGRPRGSSNKKHRKESLGSTGSGFKTHVFNVNTGE
ncbi:hypothetical protein M569_04845, partial [Genlisea aurea]